MQDRLKFRAFYHGRFIYKSLTDANYYSEDNKCIGLANSLPNNLDWEQCTSIKDRNGKLVYEGDVVDFWVCINIAGEMDVKRGIIYWNETLACFEIEDKNGYKYPMPSDKVIIGNIHQDKNPELLEK